MPESKPRKKAAPKKNPQARRNPNQAQPRKSVVPKADMPPVEPPKKPSRDPAKEIPAEERYQLVDLPEPATYEQVLVALADMDPLAQEVMIAQRLAVMPHPGDPDAGMAVPIDRRARGPWAHHLRKVGIFCIPELATHGVTVRDPATGAIIEQQTGGGSRRIDENAIWRVAREENPELAQLVDNAHTPEEKRAAMKQLASGLPIQTRIALDRLTRTTPQDLEPT